MTHPLYRESAASAHSVLANSNLTHDANVGLFFTRFYDGFTPDWEIDTNSKKGFIERTAKLASQSNHATHARALVERQERLCGSLGGQCLTLETTGPFATGTGLSHPVENGFTFHPTSGLPYLPASGVKGLLRAWVEVWLEHASAQERDTHIHDWFGTPSDTPADQASAGSLIFFDALPAGITSMACDIMTPHMGQWYEKGDEINDNNFARVAPGDWHSPVPVPFLVVSKGVKFQFAIAPRLTGQSAADASARQNVTLAMKELQNALEWVGAGAKTAVGYGRMVDTTAEQERASAKSLKDAGIASGQETWPEATVSWNKGKAELLVVANGKKCVPLTQQAARDMRAALSEDDIKKLDKGKTVTTQAVVEIQGNQTKLISLSQP